MKSIIAFLTILVATTSYAGDAFWSSSYQCQSQVISAAYGEIAKHLAPSAYLGSITMQGIEGTPKGENSVKALRNPIISFMITAVNGDLSYFDVKVETFKTKPCQVTASLITD